MTDRERVDELDDLAPRVEPAYATHDDLEALREQVKDLTAVVIRLAHATKELGDVMRTSRDPATTPAAAFTAIDELVSEIDA
ncbi:MAG TPA: hypothetical protein VFQ54_08675 [Thermomicrobiales bacterium]|nr:hypothetical protein [Thermomicrobiales bacterium]